MSLEDMVIQRAEFCHDVRGVTPMFFGAEMAMSAHRVGKMA
jgi:hypothetical protein